MRTGRELDADLKVLRQELVCAEDCTEHRTVAEIRAEIAVTRHLRDEIPPQRNA